MDKIEGWQELWDKSDGKPGFHKSEINPTLVKYFDDAIKGRKTVLVPLCGKTKDLTFLAEKGHKTIGVEFIKDAVDQFKAQEQIEWKSIDKKKYYDVYKANTGAGLEIWKGDFFMFSKAIEEDDMGIKEFDVVFDRASLVAINPSRYKEYAAIMSNVAKEILLDVFEYDQEKREGPPFSVPKETIETHFGEFFNIDKVEEIDLSGKYFADTLSKLSQVIYRLSAK